MMLSSGRNATLHQPSKAALRHITRRMIVESLENRQLMAVDSLLATNETNNSLQVFDSQGAIVRTIPLPGDFATDVSRFQENKVLIADQVKGIVTVDIKSGATQQVMSGRFLSVAYDPQTKSVLGADTHTGKLVAMDEAGSPRTIANIDGVVTCLHVFDGNYYASIVKDGRTQIDRIDRRTGNRATIFSSSGSIESFAIHIRTRTIYYGDQGRGVLGFVKVDGSSNGIIANGVRTPKGLAFISSESLAVSSTERRTIEVFHIPTGKRTILAAGTGTIEGLATLIDPTATTSPINSLARHLPVEKDYTDDQALDYWTDAPRKENAAPYQLTVSHDDIYNSKSDTPFDKFANKVLSSASDIFSLAIGLFGKVKTNGFDPNKQVDVSSKSSFDLLSGGNKNDRFEIIHPHTTAVNGKGDDRAIINAPYAMTLGNQGRDTTVFQSHSGTAIGGKDHDLYKLTPTSFNNTIYDSSPINTIDYPGKYSELDFRMQSDDLIISRDGKDLVTIKSPDFRNQEIVLNTSDFKIGLSTLLRVPDRDAVRASIAAYGENGGTDDPLLELANSGYALESRIDNDSTGLEVSIFQRSYAPALTGDVTTDAVTVDGQYVVAIAGTQDARDFRVFAFNPELQSDEIKIAAQRLINERHAKVITLTGHSGGGEVALRAARDLAIANRGVQFHVVMVNSGGVALTNVSSYNLSNLKITHYRYEADILSNPVTNAFRGTQIHGPANPLVYPQQTETIMIPFDGSGPEFSKNPAKWIDHNHAAERILKDLELDEKNSTRRFLRSSATSSSFKMPIEFSRLSPSIQEPILKATRALVKLDETLPTIPAFKMDFDFGSNSFVAPGTIPITADTIYSSSRGYGLSSSSQVRNGDEAMGDDWQRDFVTGNTIPFDVDLPMGSYDVTFMTGNRLGLDHLTVRANSRTISTISQTDPREIKETTLRVNHLGGTLKLEVQDTGGKTNHAVLNGLRIERVAPWAALPEVAISDPSLTVIVPGYVESISLFDRIEASIEPIKKIVETAGALLNPAAPITAFQIVSSFATLAQSSAKLFKAWSNETPEVPAWTIMQQIASNHQNALSGLPLQRIAYSGILLTTLESMTNEQQQKLLKNSDVIIVNAQKQLNDGVKPYGNFGDKVSDPKAYRTSIDRLSAQIYRTVANKGRAIGLADLSFQLDVQIIAEDFATVAAREAIDRIAKEDGMLAKKLGYVELLAYNPISVVQTDKLYVNFPETRPFHYVVHNFWEDITDVPKDFVKGPLDNEEGGNYFGVEVGIVRQFSNDSPRGSIRYKNFNKNNKSVQGEVVKTSFHDVGIIAYANANGYLSIVDTKKERLVFQDRIFKSKPIDLQFSPDGKNLAILNEKGLLAILNLATMTTTRVNLKQGYDAGLSWLDNNRVILAGSGGAIQSVRVAADGQLGAVTSLGRIADKLNEFWLSPVTANQQPRIVSVHDDRTVQVWNLDGNRQPQLALKTTLGVKRQVLEVDTNRGNMLITDGSIVEVFQLSGNQWVSRLTLSEIAKDSKITAGRFSNDGKLFVTGGDDQQLRVFDLLQALNGTRYPVKNYSSIMPEVKSIELSSTGDQLFVSYKDAKGGKTLDRNIKEAVSKRISLTDKLFGEEFAKAKLVPIAVIEDYPDKLRFHARRNRIDLHDLYGQEAKEDDWKFALPNSSDEVFASDDPLLGDTMNNLLPPKFQRSIPHTTVTKAMVIDLTALATDPERESITYSVASKHPSIVTATILEEQLVLAPINEGSTTITLAVTDGHRSATLSFSVTADGSLDRQRFADLRAELDKALNEQRQLQKANDVVEQANKNLRVSVEKIETDTAEYQKRLTQLTSGLSVASKEVQSIRSSITSVTQSRDRAVTTWNSAKQGVERAQQDLNLASTQLNLARDTETARQRDFQTAKSRFDNARSNQKAARRAEMEAAKAAWDAAAADRVSKQGIHKSANDTLNQWIDNRKTALNSLEELDKRLLLLERSLKDALVVEIRARQLLEQHSALRARLVETRDLLLVRLGKEQETAAENTKTATRLTASLQGILGKLQTLRQEKWVNNLGLDAWETNTLQPARKSHDLLAVNISRNHQLYVQLSVRLKGML
jgi:WD40 repeat protein